MARATASSSLPNLTTVCVCVYGGGGGGRGRVRGRQGQAGAGKGRAGSSCTNRLIDWPLPARQVQAQEAH